MTLALKPCLSLPSDQVLSTSAEVIQTPSVQAPAPFVLEMDENYAYANRQL
jgi:hypothetical protein